MPNFLSVDEFAAKLGISRSTLYDLVKQRRIAHLRLGDRIVFDEEKAIASLEICESFNGKLRDECLNGEIFYSLKEAQIVIERWRVEYNTRRPHSALGYRPPAPAAHNPLVPPNSISQPEAVM